MAITKATSNTIRSILISTLSGMVLGAVLGSGYMYQYMKTDYVKLNKTNIGWMVFLTERGQTKIYNLSELKSLN